MPITENQGIVFDFGLKLSNKALTNPPLAILLNHLFGCKIIFCDMVTPNYLRTVLTTQIVTLIN